SVLRQTGRHQGLKRMMYIECQRSGSPTVLLISGTDTASDLWHAADQNGPTVYDEIQKTTRVCAYDRPGAPHLDQTFSRSDLVPQPCDLGAKLGPVDVNEHDAFDFVRMLAGEDPCDRAAERVRDEDVGTR